MKKFIFCLFALVGLTGTVSAQTLTVSDVYAEPGKKAIATIYVESPENIYSGMKVTLQFPSTGCTIAEEGAVTAPVGNVGYTINTVGPGSITYTYALGDPFTSAIINVEFTLSSAALPEEGCEVSISGWLEGEGVSNANVENTFNVYPTDCLTLNEGSMSAPPKTSGETQIRVIRTINANEWSTICLPFYMSKEEAEEAFGEGYKLMEFYDYTATKEGTDVVNINVVFNEAEAIGEGDGLWPDVPYVIRTTKKVTEFYVNEEIEDYLDSPTQNSNTRKSGKYIGKFIGTYVANTVVPEKSLFISGNKFYYSAGLTKMKAFRAYFTFNDILADYNKASSRIKFFVGDGDNKTEIQIPELMPNDGEYYNLNGLRVETPSKGIYIKDGKKVVVK